MDPGEAAHHVERLCVHLCAGDELGRGFIGCERANERQKYQEEGLEFRKLFHFFVQNWELMGSRTDFSGSIVLDCLTDSLGNVLLIRRIGQEFSFLGMGNEAAFDENTRAV